MEPDIFEQFMFHDYVKEELWTDLTGFFAHSWNKTKVVELHQEISQASQ